MRQRRSLRLRGTSPGLGELALTAALLSILLLLGYCSSREPELATADPKGSIVVDTAGMATWADFFACYPVQDDAMILAVLRLNKAGETPDAALPPKVRIPLDLSSGGGSEEERSWPVNAMMDGSTCPVSSVAP